MRASRNAADMGALVELAKARETTRSTDEQFDIADQMLDIQRNYHRRNTPQEPGRIEAWLMGSKTIQALGRFVAGERLAS